MTPPEIRAKLPPNRTDKPCFETNKTMKATILSAAIALPLAFALASCGEKPTPVETSEEKVSAGAEKAAEGIKEMAEAATEATQDAAAEVTDAAAETVEAAVEAVEEAAADAADEIKEELGE